MDVLRGTLVESRHRGIVSVCDHDGTELAGIGETSAVTFLRSSAKPFQALPLLLSGTADHFGFDEKEIALACGSHCGEPMHVELASSMLEKVGLDRSALKCGFHEPFSREVADRLKRENTLPDVLQNNCSGKHAGMLAVAVHAGMPTDTYNEPEHPVQQSIRSIITRFIPEENEELGTATDGCNVPVYAVSVRSMATMYARLVSPPSEFPQDLRTACSRIVSAMTNYPELIGGSVGRLDTDLMRVANGTVVSKIGAEGVYTAGVLPSREYPRGLGLAFKIEDGDNLRARPVVATEALSQFGALSESQLDLLTQYYRPQLLNLAGARVGEIRPHFQLQ